MAYGRGKGKKKEKKLNQRLRDYMQSKIAGQSGFKKPGSNKK